MWLKNFIPALRVVDSISRPITMYCDNQSAVFFCANDKLSGASKHIDLKYRVVRLWVMLSQYAVVLLTMHWSGICYFTEDGF